MEAEILELEKEEMIYNILSIGEVTDGEEAAATITGKAPNQVLNLVLPRGKDDVKDYETLVNNKPKINNVELIGNKSLDDLGIQAKGNYANVNDVYNKTTIDTKVSELATNITTGNNNLSLKYLTTTLNKTSWTLNETTNLYEYNVTNANITENHYVVVDGATIEDKQKFSGTGDVNSYDGGFIISASEAPEENINIIVTYQLASSEVSS